ncbi:tubulin-tyrosine ligase family protein [Stylonychia lemnae]|uniref:Tubulin-tyrosine ligase family protein n=1 Tax=Stylonychia lemnae TaxID=5949 RepID=A0A078AD53_STYLE|nr:tubulin-tyrosine ligase family protein [Stylonychia lemnae]|eukprot:CDW79462.1 tubulin-tyrosine ligase family protein [Stylonychia lemnae]
MELDFSSVEDSQPSESVSMVPMEKSVEGYRNSTKNSTVVKQVNNTKQQDQLMRNTTYDQQKFKDVKAQNNIVLVSSSDQKQAKKEEKKKKPQYLYLCTAKTRYVVVKKACRQLGFKQTEDENADWDLYWCDTGGITPEQLSKMLNYQRINHFPGMYQLARKNNLCRNLMRMNRAFKQDYNFFPKTWILPQEMSEFRNQFNTTSKKKAKTFIVKPVHLCQGRGIFLVRKFEDVDLKQGDQYVAQRYMSKPYLIDGLKFDLRIYALVYGVDPLRVFVYQEGLGRFATEEYVGPSNGNLDNLFMHLTNYAINKNSENFVFNEDQDDDSSGHKRSLTAVLDYIRENEPQCDVDKLWQDMQDIIAKTLISVQPSLQHAYRSSQPEDLENSMCFEVLGFDIILDHKLRPYVLEVNHAASFATDSPLDKKIKLDLMKDTFSMLNLSTKRKKQLKKEKAENFNRRQMGEKGPSKIEKDLIRKKKQAERDQFDMNHLGNYKLVYPVKAQKFEQYMDQARIVWSEFTGGVKHVPQNSSNLKQSTTNLQPAAKAKTDLLTNKAKAYNLQSQIAKDTKSGNGSQNMDQSGSSNAEKVFIKRNTQQVNSAADQQTFKQGQSILQNNHYNRNNPVDLTRTNSTFNSQNVSNNAQDLSMVSPVKQETLESIQTHPADSPQHNNQQLMTPQPNSQMQSLNLHHTTGDFGVQSQNLVEAIHKRFPMVRLESSSLQNYGQFYSPPSVNNLLPNSQFSSAQKSGKINTQMSRQSFPSNMTEQQSNYNRMKPFINHPSSTSNNEQQQQNPHSASTAISSLSNNSGMTVTNISTKQKASASQSFSLRKDRKSSSQQPAMNQIQVPQYQVPINQFLFNHQSINQAVQSIDRYQILKHMDQVKRGIHPQQQMQIIRQKITNKQQSQDGGNTMQQSGRHYSTSGRGPTTGLQNQLSLAEWLSIGNGNNDPNRYKQMQQQQQRQHNQHHPTAASRVGVFKQSGTITAIQSNIIA